MSVMVLEEVGLNFADRVIVDNLGLRIAEGDRVGLIGPNGSGKTTLLKVIAGAQAVDRGIVQASRGVSVGYLPQDLAVQGGISLKDFVLRSVPGRDGLEERCKAAAQELESKSDASEEELMQLAATVAELNEKLDHFERFFSEHHALSILAGLGFTQGDHGRDLSEFSGGWQMRAVLGGLLFQKPDLLLLDEPTNHLDMPSVAWFAEFLRGYKNAFVLISHDREFLNEQISRVVSFEPEGVRQFSGNYEKYIKHRAEEEIVLQNKAKNLARERERMQRFVDRFRAQANKAAAVQSRVKALAKMDDVELYQKRRVMRFQFPPCERAVTEVAKLDELEKSYDELNVFRNVNLTIRRGDRIGIIGANGAGKTTLLKILAGELAASSGEVRLGSKVSLGYYAQHHADTLHRESTVLQEVQNTNPDAAPSRVRSILGAFLFSGDDVDKPVSVLSGGERARVALARLLIRPGNFLLMDEPTNHLDLESSESLAESLLTFDGTLAFVSHNRSLIRTLATTIWNVEDHGVEVYDGTLDEYMFSARLRAEAAVEGGKPGPVSTPAAGEVDKPVKRNREEEKARKRREAQLRNERAKVLGPLRKRVKTLEERITKLEDEQRERSALLSDKEVYDDAPRRNELMRDFQKAQEKLEELSGRWEVSAAELEQKEEELGEP